MKTAKYFLCLLMMMIALNSCLLTFYPIYTAEDVVYDASLLGSYQNNDPKDGQPDQMHLVSLSGVDLQLPNAISRIRHKGYLVRFGENDGRITSEYIAFMVTLNNNRYIDFFPHTKNAKLYGQYGDLNIPMHAVYRIALKGGKTLTLKRFNQDFLLEMISKKQIRLQHERVKDKYVITASTKELQQYISKYGDNEAAYEQGADTYTKK